ncbi:hypothetical protein BSK59_02045 [Paenibacillus odorifer]|nr:hypothetical protein BSK60_01510 [Paenibacillus odorifer]OME62273.1 hypothetical protein BSK59_02045 [Paenibacillus odorifer]
MTIKPGGLLDRVAKSHECGVCKNCGNLLKVSETTLGCAAHDKLILPDYPPYHGNAKCKDWLKEEESNQ